MGTKGTNAAQYRWLGLRFGGGCEQSEANVVWYYAHVSDSNTRDVKTMGIRVSRFQFMILRFNINFQTGC
jgi:hypothetical protein